MAPAAPEPLFPPSKTGTYWLGIVSAIVVALALAFGGYRLWQSQQGILVSGPELEQQIVHTYSALVPSVTLSANCPKTPRLHKDKIVDCSVERSDNGERSAVFVTPTDDSGHFHIQLEDTSLLIPNF